MNVEPPRPYEDDPPGTTRYPHFEREDFRGKSKQDQQFVIFGLCRLARNAYEATATPEAIAAATRIDLPRTLRALRRLRDDTGLIRFEGEPTPGVPVRVHLNWTYADREGPRGSEGGDS